MVTPQRMQQQRQGRRLRADLYMDVNNGGFRIFEYLDLQNSISQRYVRPNNIYIKHNFVCSKENSTLMENQFDWFFN